MFKKSTKNLILKKGISLLLISIFIISNFAMFSNVKTIQANANKFYNTYIFEAQDVRTPELLPGMQAIYWENGEEKILPEPLLNNEKWYNYDQKRWANAKTKDGSYWVWIPTFAYKIKYFEDADGKVLKGYTGSDSFHYADGRTTNAENVKTPYMTIETIYVGKKGNVPTDFRIHEAFYKNGLMGNGFWVAKYKATQEHGVNSNQPKYIPDAKIKKDTFDKAFIKTDLSDKSGNNYGFMQDVVKTNLALNKELGAIMYLATSQNGIKKSTVEYIPSEYTSKSETTSTTNNITGVFDLNNGNLEWTAGYIDSKRRNGSNSAILKIMKHNDMQSQNNSESNIKFESKVEKYPYNEKEDENNKLLTEEEISSQRKLNIKELIKMQNMLGGDGIYQTTVDVSRDNTNVSGAVNQYPVNKYMNIVRGSLNTDKYKSMYSYRAVDPDEKTNMFGYRTVAFRYPYKKDKYVNQTFKTTDGEIYDLTENKSYGKQVDWRLTKGTVLDNELVVKNSRKRFLRWAPISYKGMPAYNDQEFRPVFVGDNLEDLENTMYTVKFIDNSDFTKKVIKEVKVKKGENVENIAKDIVLTKSGYKFKGWNKPINTAIYQDTEFEAIFEKEQTITEKQYEVKFEDGKVLKTQYVKENTYVTPIKERPAKKGYKFEGWTPNPETTLINRSITFKPIYKKEEKQNMPLNNNEQKEYITIQFLLNGGEWPKEGNASKQAIQVIEKGGRVEEPKIYPVRKGYDFIGWDVDTTKPFYANTVIMARWQEKISSGNPDVLENDIPPVYINESDENKQNKLAQINNNTQIGTDMKYPKPIPTETTEREISRPVAITSDNKRPKVEKDIPDAGKKTTYIDKYIGIILTTILTGLLVTMYVSRQKILQINIAGRKYFDNLKNVTKK